MKTPFLLAAGFSASVAVAGLAMAQPSGQQGQGYSQGPDYGRAQGYGQGLGYGGGPGGPGGRGGPLRAVLFSQPGFQGRRLVVDHPIDKLDHFDFDDKASSMRVHGAWLICEDDHFHGHCETVDHPVDDLAIIHMNNKVSSIRPLGPGPGGPGVPPPGY